MKVNFHRTGITADEVSARSLCTGGAMALLCGKLDINLIQSLGRWHTDATIRYLHMQAQPIFQHFAAKIVQQRQLLLPPRRDSPSPR
jgi:hypothetical protein